MGACCGSNVGPEGQINTSLDNWLLSQRSPHYNKAIDDPNDRSHPYDIAAVIYGPRYSGKTTLMKQLRWACWDHKLSSISSDNTTGTCSNDNIKRSIEYHQNIVRNEAKKWIHRSILLAIQYLVRQHISSLRNSELLYPNDTSVLPTDISLILSIDIMPPPMISTSTMTSRKVGQWGPLTMRNEAMNIAPLPSHHNRDDLSMQPAPTTTTTSTTINEIELNETKHSPSVVSTAVPSTSVSLLPTNNRYGINKVIDNELARVISRIWHHEDIQKEWKHFSFPFPLLFHGLPIYLENIDKVTDIKKETTHLFFFIHR
jgi:hypothetical protein